MDSDRLVGADTSLASRWPRYSTSRRLASVTRRASRFAVRNPVSAVSVLVLVIVVLMAIFAPVVASHDPYFASPLVRLQGPSSEHWFGTDGVGRDVFARIVFGARVSLGVAFAAVVLSMAVGAMIGMLSGYLGGKVDLIIQRFSDAIQAFPALILAMLVVSMFGQGRLNSLIPITVIFVPGFIRIVRASVFGAKEADYVTASRTVGAGAGRVLFVHILPNVSAPILIMASLTFGYAILVEASLSFLGLGTQPPDPSWGGMLASDGRRFLGTHPHLLIFPAVAISLVVLAVNIIGDTLRDALDPQLRNR